MRANVRTVGGGGTGANSDGLDNAREESSPTTQISDAQLEASGTASAKDNVLRRTSSCLAVGVSLGFWSAGFQLCNLCFTQNLSARRVGLLDVDP